MSLDVVVLGLPGAGKGTQAQLMAAEAGIPHIATGDMIRAMKEQDTPLGRELRAVYDRGDLVSDELMIQLIRARLAEPDTGAGFVLDGFPRTVAQVEALDSMLEEIGRGLAVVLRFVVPDDVAVERLHGRALQEGRSDDTADVIRHRLDVFHRETAPAVDHYRDRGLLVDVDADRSVEDVFADVRSTLEAAAAT
ncbi:MAG TPA: adenylate kinase [Gaiellaceae bacterium]|nr:adenylate kinase [Gaiellaceae bacterium]